MSGRTGRVWHVSPEVLPDIPEETQFRTISEAAVAAEPGDTVTIHTGFYRECVVTEKHGSASRPIVFEAAPAAHVVVTGADVITDWRRESETDSIYSTPWPHVFIEHNPGRIHPDTPDHVLIGRAEQVVLDGYVLHQALACEQLSRGSFYVDEADQRLYLWYKDDREPPKFPRVIEAATRSQVWVSRGDYTTMRGLRFRYAANAGQQGAVELRGSYNVVEDCLIEKTNSIGLDFRGHHQTARRCVIQDHGQMGFSAYLADDILMTACVVRNNNTKGFSRSWEAGGNKLTACNRTVIEKSVFVENRGCGIWFDGSNKDCVIRHNLIADNEDAGIFYEISYGLHAHDNVLAGNGFANEPGGWHTSAICISSSPNCVVERNLVIGNREGVTFLEEVRSAWNYEAEQAEAIWNHDDVIRNNVVAYNRDAQTRAWVVTRDERHWPAAMQTPGPKVAVAAEDEQEVPPPTGLSLEKLNLNMHDNLYATADNQPLCVWADPARSKTYASLEEVGAALGLEQGSRCQPLVFANYLTRDFRLPADSPALEMHCYPKGTVPGVKLGVVRRK